MAQVITRETILQELEGLAADRIPEVLDFIRFLESQKMPNGVNAVRRSGSNIPPFLW